MTLDILSADENTNCLEYSGENKFLASMKLGILMPAMASEVAEISNRLTGSIRREPGSKVPSIPWPTIISGTCSPSLYIYSLLRGRFEPWSENIISTVLSHNPSDFSRET